ncbi:MAG TPA: hypothetical protein VMD59_14880, partial [Acidimicrobiales bacterium]|nr:hypothetical protein [Acidimicrobiales bacterium]
MDEQLEAELRRVFSSHASEVTAGAAERLRRIDYHPRARRISPLVTAGTLGGAAAGAIASVVVLGAAQPAFAGWRASPTPASSGQTASAEASCQS